MESSPSIEESRSALSGSGELARSVLFNNALDTFKSISTNAITCKSTSRPPSPVVGQMIFESDTQQVYFWNGTVWMAPGSPSGSMQAFAGATSPAGWLLCDGSLYTAAVYPTLYAVLGVTYGGTLGVSFNVPNMAGRIAVGAGTGGKQGATGSGVISGGTALTARTIGQFFGDERLQSHTHTFSGLTFSGLGFSGTTSGQSANHTHDFNPRSAAGWNSGATQLIINGGSQYWGLRSTANNGDGGTTGPTYGYSADHSHTYSGTTAGGTTAGGTTADHNQTAGAQQNLQPSVVTNYIIKT